MENLPFPREELKHAGYELFILAVSLLAVFNSVLLLMPVLTPVSDQVLRTINFGLALLFLADFLYRLTRSIPRSDYFIRRFGWADLLSSVPLPAFQLFRLSRLVRSIRLLRELGGRAAVRAATGKIASGALYLLLLLAILLIEFAAVFIVSIEASSPEANIKTGSDALWWTYVTITSVGYGDRYPVTNGGRVVGALVMSVGLGLYSVLTGFLANTFIGHVNQHKEESTAARMSDQVDDESDDPLVALTELQTLLAEQQQHFARLSEKMTNMERRLRDQNAPS